MSKKFLPLAITLAEDEHACVAGIDDHDEWVRPEPILASQVQDPSTPFRHFTWVEAELAPSEVAEPRIEDRRLLGKPKATDTLTRDEQVALLHKHIDVAIGDVFGGMRSLGLVHARIERIYVWEWGRRQSFLRVAFREPSGELHDWLLPDYRISKVCFTEEQDRLAAKRRAEFLASALCDADALLAISLTRPSKRFPGKYRGCHPLVVAIHGKMELDTILQQAAML